MKPITLLEEEKPLLNAIGDLDILKIKDRHEQQEMLSNSYHLAKALIKPGCHTQTKAQLFYRS